MLSLAFVPSDFSLSVARIDDWAFTLSLVQLSVVSKVARRTNVLRLVRRFGPKRTTLVVVVVVLVVALCVGKHTHTLEASSKQRNQICLRLLFLMFSFSLALADF